MFVAGCALPRSTVSPDDRLVFRVVNSTKSTLYVTGDLTIWPCTTTGWSRRVLREIRAAQREAVNSGVWDPPPDSAPLLLQDAMVDAMLQGSSPLLLTVRSTGVELSADTNQKTGNCSGAAPGG